MSLVSVSIPFMPKSPPEGMDEIWQPEVAGKSRDRGVEGCRMEENLP